MSACVFYTMTLPNILNEFFLCISAIIPLKSRKNHNSQNQVSSFLQ